MVNVGDRAEIVKQFTADDVRKFAEVSLDTNPLHLDAAFAANTQFGKPIVHGMLVASLFSAILGTIMPGMGTIYLGQEVSFRKPVFVGDTVTASVEVVEVRTNKPLCKLKTLCRNAEGDVVIDGTAVVMLA